jgi:hypothetical protein
MATVSGWRSRHGLAAITDDHDRWTAIAVK